jgi:hypothetical protein
MSVVVFGGAGVFGTIVAEELNRHGVHLTIASRNLQSSERVAERIGCRAIQADLLNPDLCRAALQQASVAVNCAGPFNEFDATLLEACLDCGCHYVDIADDRRYARLVLSFNDRFSAAGLTAVYGCSSLPGISGALALRAKETLDDETRHARVTLFIGNNNAKGSAAVRSATGLLGKTIEAPQGLLKAFAGPEHVTLPLPFGPRRVINFESPDYELLPKSIGAESVVVKVGFELRLVTTAFRCASLAPWLGRHVLPQLTALNSLTKALGCSGGAVMVELFAASGGVCRSSMAGARDGQRMAALPAVYAVRTLLSDDSVPRGAMPVYDVVGARELLDSLVADDFELHLD